MDVNFYIKFDDKLVINIGFFSPILLGSLVSIT